MSQKQSFAERISKLRVKHRMTLREVAQKIDVPVSTYKEWESGRKIRGEPYLKIAEIYQVSLHELFTGEKPKGFHLIESLDSLESQIRRIKTELISYL